MRTKKFWQICIPALILFIGIALGAYVYRAHIKSVYEPSTMPDSTTVKIDSTNLPIVFIDTQRNTIERNDFINAYIKIIDNGKKRLNYGDTLAHPKQKVDYEGFMAIKYRGNSSYALVAKKSYAIRAIDTAKGEKKKKSKLLGMRKGKKWALKAVPFDKSMIRDALTYELACPYMDFVPQTRFCEVIIDGIYHGVYSLSEQITADRLKLEKPNDSDRGRSGGYLLQMDFRAKREVFMSKYWTYGYRYEYPEGEKLSQSQKEYLNDYIYTIEKKIVSNSENIFGFIDMLSMIDYQLASEFSHNVDAYRLSTFIYKYRDEKDPRLKFSLWDFDLGYGNCSAGNASCTDTWMYEKHGSWWMEAMKKTIYTDCVKERWKQYRNEEYSDEHINHVIDSLTNVLTVCGAEQRNADAWKPYTLVWKNNNMMKPQKYISSSYEEEIAYLKDWISRRLRWMDKELLGEE